MIACRAVYIASVSICATLIVACGHRSSSTSLYSGTARPASCFGDPFSARVTKGLKGYADVVDIPGVSIGIVAADSLIYSTSYGYADRTKKTPATADTPYNIASVTKVFTATLAVMLAEESSLDLDAAAQHYLPDSLRLPIDTTGRAFTVRQLITHTSGLPKDPPNRRNIKVDGPLDPGVWDAYNISDLYQALAVTKVAAVGKQHRYSNFGYALLGHILERVSGRRYETLLHERILAPLLLNETAITLRPDQQERLASFYWSDDVKRVEQPVHARYGEVAGFIGLTSTVTDLAKFVSAHLGSRRISNPVGRRVADAMAHPEFSLLIDPLGRDDVALGWFRSEFLDDAPSRVILFHTGDVDGHTAGIYLLPRKQLGIVILQNLGGIDGSRGIEQFGSWLGRLVSHEWSACRSARSDTR